MTICWVEEVSRHLKIDITDMTSEEAFQWIIDQYTKGVSLTGIANKLRVSYGSVSRLLRGLGVKIKGKGGPRNKVECVVTEEEFKTCTYREVAERQGVSITTVKNRCKPYRKERKHVDLRSRDKESNPVEERATS